MKPFKGEDVDGTVNGVSKVRPSSHPLITFRFHVLTISCILYRLAQMGVFLDVGPLSVFISTHVSPIFLSTALLVSRLPHSPRHHSSPPIE